MGNKLTRRKYDKRRLPSLYFTRDYSVKGIHLFLEGEEYTPYLFNFSRMIDLFKAGLLTIHPIKVG